MSRVFFDRQDDGSEVLYAQSYFDLAELRSAERTDKGFLRVQGRISRPGVFHYMLEDGRRLTVLRPPDEVFSLDSLRTFELAPITIEHPTRNGRGVLLTPETAKEFSVGSVASPQRMGNHVVADMMITDAKAIALVESGKRKLSAGYSADLWIQSGTFVDDDGKRTEFNAVQRNIRGNHVAITDKPRMGPTTEIQFDGGVYDGEAESMKTKKIKIRGIEVELDEKIADAIEAAESKDAKESKQPELFADSVGAELKKENSELKGRLAALESKLSDKSKSDEMMASKAKIKSRMALVTVVASAIGLDSEKDDAKHEATMDSLLEMEPIDLMKKVIEVRSDIDVKDSTDENFVRGVFTALTKTKPEARKKLATDEDGEDNGLLDALRTKKPKIEVTDEEDENPVQSSYAKMVREDSEAWKTGLYPKKSEAAAE